MSIVVNLRYTGVNGNAAKFAQEMEKSGTADLIRAEDGNLRYEYYIPMNDPETVLLIDAWKDQEAIDKHHASPMMQTIARGIFPTMRASRRMTAVLSGTEKHRNNRRTGLRSKSGALFYGVNMGKILLIDVDGGQNTFFS